MSSHLSNGHNGAHGDNVARLSIKDLPKSDNFTSHLPADAAFPTPSDSHRAPREKLGPRIVRGAAYTYVRPETVANPELLSVSAAAMRDIGIKEEDQETNDFKEMVCGNKIVTWDPEKKEGIYPWAHCYGGKDYSVEARSGR